MKRVFIEVSVGDESDPVGRLRRMGVPESSIRVEEVEDPLASVLLEETGVTLETIRSKDSTRDVVMARTIYIHHRRQMGDSGQTIARSLGRDDSSVRWYIRHYDESMQGDFVFKASALRCAARLDANPYWCPPEPPKPNRSKKKGKRRRLRDKNRTSK